MEQNVQKERRKEKRWWVITKWFLLFFITFLLILGYSHFFAPHFLKTKEIKLTDSKITESFHGFKIVQFSDLHYGATTNQRDLVKIQKEINRLKADIVIFTGDLFEKDIQITEEKQNIITSFLEGITANISKYAITGEDDYGNSSYPIILENGGFQLLDEKYDLIYNENYEAIFIAGMSTTTHGTKNAKDKMKVTMDYFTTLESNTEENPDTQIERPIYTILITHEPDSIMEINYTNFDLILAGHSHLGQVRLPFIGGLCYPGLSKKFKNDHYTMQNTELYISGGLGTTKIPFRLFNTPEISLYRLTKQ